MDDCTWNRLRPNDFKRFYDFVLLDDGCWIWSGAKTKPRRGYPYGNFWYEGRFRLAHRCSYHLLVGCCCYAKILRHTCDNGLCVNPKHLIPGTHKENMQDSLERNRHPVGVNTYNAKFDEKALKHIRARVMRAVDYAALYGCSKWAIFKVLSGDRYSR